MSSNQTTSLRIVVGSDNCGHLYKSQLKAELEQNPGVSHVLDVGVAADDDDRAYPNVAIEAAEKILSGEVRPISLPVSKNLPRKPLTGPHLNRPTARC